VNFYWKVGLGAAVVLSVAFAALFLLPRGDAAEVERLLQETLEAARKGDADRVCESVSKSYGSEPGEYEDACATIRRHVGPGRYKNLEIRDLKIGVAGESATARFTLRVVDPKGLGIPHFDRKLSVDLRKEGGIWKVVSARSDPER